MYDDFDLVYTYDYSSSLDEDYADNRYYLDENEEHARESTAFQELAYLHYAWCMGTRSAVIQSYTRLHHLEGRWCKILVQESDLIDSSWGTRVFFLSY